MNPLLVKKFSMVILLLPYFFRTSSEDSTQQFYLNWSLWNLLFFQGMVSQIWIMPYLSGFKGIYCRNPTLPRYGTSCSSTVMFSPGTYRFCRLVITLSRRDLIGENLSLTSLCCLSSKRRALIISWNLNLLIVALKSVIPKIGSYKS